MHCLQEMFFWPDHMDNLNIIEEFLLEQFRKYPQMQPLDMLKVIHQSEFGCAHFVSDEGNGFELLQQELKNLLVKACTGDFIEPLGDTFCRVHLAGLQKNGLSPKTLFNLFGLTSRKNSGSEQTLLVKLEVFKELCDSGKLPFDPPRVQKLIQDFKNSEFEAVHHSKEFKQHYSPAYRVVRRDLCNLLPLYARIDQLLSEKESVVVAIDGNCTSGKSTLADQLQAVYDCNLFHIDFFFLQPHQRTEERLLQPGGNVDYERFRLEVLDPLLTDNDFSYRPFDCKIQELSIPLHIQQKRLNVVEGVYCMHPTLSDVYDLRVFLRIDEETQRMRLFKRNNPQLQKRFIEEWIPLESLYFKNMNVEERCDLVFEANDILNPLFHK